MNVTMGFCPCDICRIGLGNFMYRTCTSRMVTDWVMVKGEDKYAWKWGKVKQRYQVFRKIVYKNKNRKSHLRLVWHSKVIKPKYVCWECLDKYAPNNFDTNLSPTKTK